MTSPQTNNTKSNLESTLLLRIPSLKVDLGELERRLLEDLAPEAGALSDMLRFVLGSGGKRFRAGLCFAVARVLLPVGSNILSERFFLLAEIAELIHTASLVHDDFLDEAKTRRGLETLHLKWNPKYAVIGGDFLFAQASLRLGLLENCAVVKIFAQVLCSLCKGEIKQAEDKYKSRELNLEAYIGRCHLKTASLFEACTESAALLAELETDRVALFGHFGMNLGLAFQVIDDLLDFTSTEQTLGKDSQSDLPSGIFTAPVIFACEEDLSIAGSLLEASELGFTAERTASIMTKIKATGALGRTLGLAQSYIARSKACLEDLGLSASSGGVLVEICDLVLNRATV